VSGVRVGDRLACIEGWGALAKYVVTRPRNALVFDDRISLADGCLLEVLPGVAMAAWKTGAGRGADVLVVGQGLSGLLITALAAVHGCRRLVAADPSPVKAALATELGATDARIGRLCDVTGSLREAYPEGFDLAIVATPGCIVNEVVPLMRPRSRIVAYGGLEDAACIDVMALHHRSVSLVKEGELINGVREARAVWREALQLAYDGVLPLGRLRTHDLPMADAEAALRLRAAPGSDAIHVVLHQDPTATMPDAARASR
jgi:L-iditol 2-dehydrogenase